MGDPNVSPLAQKANNVQHAIKIKMDSGEVTFRIWRLMLVKVLVDWMVMVVTWMGS